MKPLPNRSVVLTRSALVTFALLVPCAYLLAQQIASLEFPIVGEHRWRQADVYAVAYNFAHEGADFFHPRIDWTNGQSGIMGMEPPILPYLIAGALRLWGDDAAVARWVAWSVCMLGLLGFALGLARERATAFGGLALLCLLLAPMGLFELRQIQPDAPAAMLAGAAALLFVRASRSERKRDFAAALALFTLAVLLKGPAIVLAPAMPLFAASARPVRLPAWIGRAAWLIVPAALIAGWFRWADRLTAEYSPRRSYFALAPKPGELMQNLSDLRGLTHVLTELYPQYAINGWLVPAALLGIALAIVEVVRRGAGGFVTRPSAEGDDSARKRRWMHLGFGLWLLCVTAFLTAFSSRLHAHWYYADLVLPPLAYFTACGLWPAWSALLEPRPRARAVRYLLVLAIAAVVPLAARDALAVLERRSAAELARDYRARVLVPLRAEVARFSTRADLILTNGRDPSTLHDALRKGFTASYKAISVHKLGFFARRHALIYVHLVSEGPTPPELVAQDPRYPLLTRQRGFRIYCLQSSCPERAR